MRSGGPSVGALSGDARVCIWICDRCIRLPSGRGMAELVNLRIARKRAKKRQDDLRADSNRLAHGQPKHRRKLAAAQQEKASRDLDSHRIDKGAGR